MTVRLALSADVPRIMQHNLLEHGFTYCGIINLASGDPRQAYQKVL